MYESKVQREMFSSKELRGFPFLSVQKKPGTNLKNLKEKVSHYRFCGAVVSVLSY